MPGNTGKIKAKEEAAAAGPSNAKDKKKLRPDQSPLPPISDIPSMFEDMVDRIGDAMLDLVKHLSGRKLRVATMCSGTESPLLALNLISRALKKKYGITLEVEHVFSCEIVPWKQAYIERNFQPPVLFRDVCELEEDKATTAYGAMATVPGNVDMLIAGTSCVDYSTLNNRKQDIDAKGESGQTFRGMMGWVKRHKPAIVILENVCSAPWDRIQERFEKADYSAVHARFDTKQYYLPHTRNRGYLYAIRGAGDNAVLRWTKRVKTLEREASVPYDELLLQTDDPRIQQGREKLVREESNIGKGHDWAKCETRHARERVEKLLGNRRPLTNWDENGTCKMLDFAWIDWANSQVDRVWDLLDISFLVKAAQGTDATFKSMVWNLSQNVDREIGTKRHGICPCLTPSMIPYLNFRGGPMLGLEALALQGLPVDELILTRETEDNLADLAGNAMSSTVVGAVMLSALLLSKHRLEGGPGTTKGARGDTMAEDMEDCAEGVPDNKIVGDDQLQESPFDLTTTANSFSLPELLKLAAESSRLCTCEGRGAVTDYSIARCEDCHHSSCVRCGGRPKHNYRSIDFAAHPRSSPLAFEQQAKEVLPMCLHVSRLNVENVEALKSSVPFSASIPLKGWKSYITALAAAVSQEFRFRDLKRQATWTATFDSPTGFLEFEMHPTSPEWRLFAKPDSLEPANSHVRTILSRPVARLKVQDRLFDGTWELAFPVDGDAGIGVKVEGIVDEAAEGKGLVPAWEAGLGLEAPHLMNKKVWARLKIAVEGHDKRQFDIDISGTYRWLPNCAAACGSLHIREETDPTRAPLFFFLDPTKYGENNEDPFVFSRTFRRYEYGEERPRVARFETTWRQGSMEPATVRCFVDHRWVQAPEGSLETATSRAASFTVPKQELQITTDKDSCRVTQALLTAKVDLGENAPAMWPRNKWVEVDKIHERATFRGITFLLERLRNVPGQGRWIETTHHEGSDTKCQVCAPKSPDIHWETTGSRTVAFEDPEQAGQYERALKNRPPPFVTQLTLDKQGFGHVRIGCNIATLVHRAISCLPCRTESLVTSYRITTDYNPPAKLVRPKFQLTSNRDDPEHAQPPDFRIALRPEQRRSLDWMIRQEAEDVLEFEEEEIAEAILLPLGWRTEAKASRSVRVRGGVLADEVGYGKTAITLGLISCANHDRPYQKPKEDVTKGLIATKATLVVVPPHLTRQWTSEVEKFTKKAFVVKTISTLTELNKLSIQAILDADLIIVASSLFRSGTYLENFEGFAGKGELPPTYGRYWHDRHRISVEGIREQAKRLQKNRTTAVMNKIVEGSNIDATQGVPKGPSKRLRGAQYRANQTTKDVEAPVVGPSTSSSANPSRKRKVMHEVDIDPCLPDPEGLPAPKVQAAGSDQKSEADEQPGNKPAAKRAKRAPSSAPKKLADAKKRKLTADSDRETEANGEGSKAPKGKGRATLPERDAPPASKKRRFEKDPWKLNSPKVKGDFTRMQAPPLELFHWHRLVIDEYTYLKDKAHVMITGLAATHRWVLSGTPPIHDFASVKTIAVFLGLHLGVDDDDEAPTNNRKSNKTAAEQFHSFREVRSVDWYRHRYDVGQRFLDQFVRKNIAEIDEIPFREVPVIVQLPAAERALERELEHTLRAQDMNIRRIHKTGSDRERRIAEILGESKSAQEALLKTVAFYDNFQSNADNAMKACDYVVKVRTADRNKCLRAIRATLKLLEEQKANLELEKEKEQGDVKSSAATPKTLYAEWLEVASTRGVGDPDATEAVLKLHRKATGEDSDDEEGSIADSEGQPTEEPTAKEEAEPKHDDDNPGGDHADPDAYANLEEQDVPENMSVTEDIKKPAKKADALWDHRQTAQDLRSQVKELVGRYRSLRYFNLIRSVQQEPGPEQAAFTADCPKCGKKGLTASELSLLSMCGHFGCHACVRMAALEEQCLLGSQKCSALARLLNILRADSFGTDDGIKDAERHFGKKLEVAIDIIKDLISRGERILLFIQFTDLMEKVAGALAANGITALQIQGNAGTKSKNLETFQNPEAAEKVLLLGLENESASGANLTVANHVMFLSPMWPKNQEEYVATETQAIGRARRYGQTKEVKIWRFIAKDTIDVQVYEQFCGINYQKLAEQVGTIEGIIDLPNPTNASVAPAVPLAHQDNHTSASGSPSTSKVETPDRTTRGLAVTTPPSKLGIDDGRLLGSE